MLTFPQSLPFDHPHICFQAHSSPKAKNNNIVYGRRALKTTYCLVTLSLSNRSMIVPASTIFCQLFLQVPSLLRSLSPATYIMQLRSRLYLGVLSVSRRNSFNYRIWLPGCISVIWHSWHAVNCRQGPCRHYMRKFTTHKDINRPFMLPFYSTLVLSSSLFLVSCFSCALFFTPVPASQVLRSLFARCTSVPFHCWSIISLLIDS